MPRFCSIDLNVLRAQYPEMFCKFCVAMYGKCPAEALIDLFREQHPYCTKESCLCEKDGE